MNNQLKCCLTFKVVNFFNDALLCPVLLLCVLKSSCIYNITHAEACTSFFKMPLASKLWQKQNFGKKKYALKMYFNLQGVSFPGKYLYL